MLTTKFNIEIAKEVWQEEAREEVREEANRVLIQKMHSKGMSDAEISKMTDMTLEEVRGYIGEPSPPPCTSG